MDAAIENAELRIPAEVVSCALGDEIVLLALDSGVYFGLEGVGVRVWELLAGGARSARGIWSTVISEYDVDPERCWEDIRRFLEEMCSRGLIRIERDGNDVSTVSPR
jgi:hypothetical protein